MPVIGIGLTKMEAKKIEDITGAVKVNSGMNVTDIKEIDLPAFKTKGMAIDFEYRTKYLDNKSNKILAEISIDGNVIFVGDDQEKILKDWKKDKSLSDVIKFEVIRVVSDKCSKKAILLSDDLQLPPPPLMMPQAFRQEKEEKKTG
ncbi:hypothetical protein A3K64_03015 [Candidatus Micrarchaeota archaeon RBG_16_36_9]|nr:MAG: hypothetical protein A3K64_03015 [Candidatus Micrarchaeota archaeon RBG_16_36_9]